MYNSPCDLAKFLENTSKELLEAETASKIWKVRETSLTDLIVAAFRVYSSLPNIEVDASDETVTGADFEVVFRNGGKDIAILFQAKRSKSTKTGKFNAPELFHPQSSGKQNLDLINYCINNKILPRYAFYLSKSALNFLVSTGTHNSPSGIMTECAAVVRSNGFIPGSTPNTLMISKHLRRSIPFHFFFCKYLASNTLDDFLSEIPITEKLEAFVSRSSLHDSHWKQSFITDQIPLSERKIRDELRLVKTRILITR